MQINPWKANCRALPHSKEAFGEKATLGYSMEELFERERGPEGRLIKPHHRTSDIIYLNAETFGWGWSVHSCRPR